MVRYTLTTLDKLKPGDTFHKHNDLTDTVYTLLEMKCTYGGMFYVRKGELKCRIVFVDTDMMDKDNFRTVAVNILLEIQY